MDWLKGIVDPKKDGKRTGKKDSKKYYVRNSDKKILVAHKSPSGKGFVYKTQTDSGSRNIHINGNLYNTKEDALKKVEKLKRQQSK